MTARMAFLEAAHPVYRQLETRFESDQGIMWCYLDAKPRPCFNPELLADLRKFERAVEMINRTAQSQGKECPIQYVVCGSRTPGVFSLGGDLDLFIDLIKRQDGDGLKRYAKACIDVLHPNAVNYNLPMTTISLVQGDALGGGFETALCCNVIVAEERARFGLPEILFNLFPGMGAYSLLARRLDAARAEKIITSGRVYTASELHEMGVVDVVAKDGEGESAVYDFIGRRSRRRNSYQALYRVRQRYSPVSYEELIDIAEIWADAAMKLEPRDLRLMERLGRAQDRMQAAPPAESPGEGRLDAVPVHA